MKRVPPPVQIATAILVTCTLVAESCLAQATALIGHWEGAYGRLGSIQTMAIDLDVRAGELVGTFDVPDLSIFGEPIADLSFSPPTLTLRVTYGLFTMHVFPDLGEMTGENAKWNPALTLHLKRREKRPATPLPREDVRFENGSVSVAGTLVWPRAPGPHPAVVVVHGSGDEGRGSGHYAFWGDFFARHGVAALLYDKRGVGASAGDHRAATFDDLAGDAVAAVEALKKRPGIEPARIGLFGISQGGWLAPLAASRTPHVSFLILNVGPAVTVEEQELDRVEYSLRADELSDEDVEEALAYTRRDFAAAYSGKNERELFAQADEVRKKKWAETVQVVASDADLRGWRLIRYDPAPVLRNTKLPLLALFGELDSLVPPTEIVDRMRASLEEAGNTEFTIRVIPGVGHDMEIFGTLRGGRWDWPESYWVWPRKSPEFYSTIAGWLKDRGIASPR